jgi:hypothetical protein
MPNGRFQPPPQAGATLGAEVEGSRLQTRIRLRLVVATVL